MYHEEEKDYIKRLLKLKGLTIINLFVIDPLLCFEDFLPVKYLEFLN